MKQNETKNKQKNIEDYYCSFCNFICSKKSNYNAHLTTRKHQTAVNETNMKQLEKIEEQTICQSCGKKFNSRTTLWRHKKKCHNNNTDEVLQNESVNTTHDSSAIIELIKQNSDFKELIIEQTKLIQEQNKSILELSSKNVTTNMNNCNNTNNNNQKFNLNFFLNTTCKDAMNMSEFIENIDINFEDIENIGRNGYVTGMTDMILSRIKELDVTKRPLHCTDLKRETMYIKDNNEWSKDTPDNKRLHKMISIVAKRNYATIPLWREKYPECQNWNDPKYEFCVDMMRNILGDIGEQQTRLDNKIIRKLSQHLVVNKN
jgi:hypothetical protein